MPRREGRQVLPRNSLMHHHAITDLNNRDLVEQYLTVWLYILVSDIFWFDLINQVKSVTQVESKTTRSHIVYSLITEQHVDRLL